MATNYESRGSKIEKGDTTSYLTSATWTKIGCATNIDWSGVQVTDVEVPACLDDAVGYKDFIPGDVDGGTITVTLNYNASEFTEGLDSLREEGAWRIKLGETTDYFRFNGYANNFTPTGLSNGSFLSYSVTFKISGSPDINSGS